MSNTQDGTPPDSPLSPPAGATQDGTPLVNPTWAAEWQAEVAKLQAWLLGRLQWLDQQIAPPAANAAAAAAQAAAAAPAGNVSVVAQGGAQPGAVPALPAPAVVASGRRRRFV